MRFWRVLSVLLDRLSFSYVFFKDLLNRAISVWTSMYAYVDSVFLLTLWYVYMLFYECMKIRPLGSELHCALAKHSWNHMHSFELQANEIINPGKRSAAFAIRVFRLYQLCHVEYLVAQLYLELINTITRICSQFNICLRRSITRSNRHELIGSYIVRM